MGAAPDVRRSRSAALDPSGARRPAAGAARHGGVGGDRREPAGRAISRRSTACRSTIRPRKASCAARPSCIRSMKHCLRAPRAISGCYNDHDGVLGVGSDRSLLYFTCTAERVPGRLDDWMRNTAEADADRHPGDRDRRCGGRDRRPAARLRYRSRPGRATSSSARPDGICFFNLLSDGPDRDRRIDALVEATRSFRDLSDARPRRFGPIACASCRAAAPRRRPSAARMPYPDLKLERLLALNGVDDAAELRAARSRSRSSSRDHARDHERRGHEKAAGVAGRLCQLHGDRAA